MEKEHVRIPIEELKEAAAAFDFDFRLKIHRFPQGLRGVGDRYIVPMAVAIGPYHRDASDGIKKMEEVKRAAAFRFCESWRWEAKSKVYEEVYSVAGRARERYAEEAVKEYRVDESLRRFLFANRACINNDIMLMENQLPWLVVDKIINSSYLSHINYNNVVGKFIARMRNTFKIAEELDRDDIANDFNAHDARDVPHLLGLLRRPKTAPATKLEWPKVFRISSASAIELAEIGIKLKASKEQFAEMAFDKRPLCGELSLAPLSLNDTRACWLVNMAAFEVSTASTFLDDPSTTAVCSYLAVLSMFMLREEDVCELRSKGILHGHHTNAEMLTFFKTVVNHLPGLGCRYANIMVHIEDYKKNRWLLTKLHKFVYNNFRTIMKVLTIVGTLVGIFQALLALNRGQKNHTPGQYLSFLPA